MDKGDSRAWASWGYSKDWEVDAIYSQEKGKFPDYSKSFHIGLLALTYQHMIVTLTASDNVLLLTGVCPQSRVSW